MTWGCREVPHAILLWWIVVRIVRTEDLAIWCRHFVLATSLLTIVAIVLQGVSIMTGTYVRAKCIFAFVLTSTIVDCTFIHVGGEDCSKSSLLDRFVRLELHPQRVTVGGYNWRYFGSAENSMLLQVIVVQFGVNCNGVIFAFRCLVKGVALQFKVGKV